VRIPEKTKEGIAYTVDVELPEGLTSTYHRTFPFVRNMDGTADYDITNQRLTANRSCRISATLPSESDE